MRSALPKVLHPPRRSPIHPSMSSRLRRGATASPPIVVTAAGDSRLLRPARRCRASNRAGGAARHGPRTSERSPNPCAVRVPSLVMVGDAPLIRAETLVASWLLMPPRRAPDPAAPGVPTDPVGLGRAGARRKPAHVVAHRRGAGPSGRRAVPMEMQTGASTSSRLPAVVALDRLKTANAAGRVLPHRRHQAPHRTGRGASWLPIRRVHLHQRSAPARLPKPRSGAGPWMPLMLSRRGHVEGPGHRTYVEPGVQWPRQTVIHPMTSPPGPTELGVRDAEIGPMAVLHDVRPARRGDRRSSRLDGCELGDGRAYRAYCRVVEYRARVRGRVGDAMPRSRTARLAPDTYKPLLLRCSTRRRG